jgi:hypothetical protein
MNTPQLATWNLLPVFNQAKESFRGRACTKTALCAAIDNRSLNPLFFGKSYEMVVTLIGYGSDNGAIRWKNPIY